MSILYLAIPVAIGILAGIAVSYVPASNSAENEPALSLASLTAGGSPVLGDPGAPVTIIEWGDYQCTFCFKFHQSTLKILERDYIDSGKARLVFRDFPLNGPDSVLGAQATYCAGDQQRYWEYHDILYLNWAGEKTGWITRDSLRGFANDADLDTASFDECMDKNTHEGRVLALESHAKRIGIDATPTFFVTDGTEYVVIRGNQPLEVFMRVIDGML